MKKKRKPTIRQKRAAKFLAKGGSVADAMRKAGYSESMARNPQYLTESEAWKDLLEKIIPDKMLIDTHRAALSATKTVVCDKEMTDVPDHGTRLRAVELGHRLKGHLVDRVGNPDGSPLIPVDRTAYREMSDDELRARLSKALSQ